MRQFDVQVRVGLKPSVFDPQGNAVEKSISGLGHTGVSEVRIGKYMHFYLESEDAVAAKMKVKELCDTVLCNPVIETYDFQICEMADGSPVAQQPDLTQPALTQFEEKRSEAKQAEAKQTEMEEQK